MPYLNIDIKIIMVVFIYKLASGTLVLARKTKQYAEDEFYETGPIEE